MGLDGVEIVMDIEDQFGITIPDDDCERILTIGGMAQYLYHRLNPSAAPLHAASPCPTSQRFYRLRKTIREALGSASHPLPERIRPQTRLSTLLRPAMRTQFWVDLELAGLRAPPLRYNEYIGMVTVLAAGAIGATVMLPLALIDRALGILGLVLIAPIVCALAVFIHRKTHTLLPSNCATVGDLARQCSLEPLPPSETGTACIGKHEAWRENPDLRMTDFERASILDKIRIIVAEHMNIPLEKLHAETRFQDILE